MNSPAAPGGVATEPRHGQLPADVSEFIGRTRELAALAEMLASARLVTVTGPGGVGKSRLALRAAAEASGRYPGGTCLGDLSGLADPRLLPATVTRCLRSREHDPRSPHAAIGDQLRGQRLLLILDTCEHLADACARLVAPLLRETAELTILTTSRQPLHVPGELVLRLGPLPVPDSGNDRAPGDAVDFFATRAAAALPGFTVTPAVLPDVIRLCRRLDGMPLALELAAVRVRALPLPELVRRLDTTFSLLSGARRGMVPRHQTLRAAIEWSYDLCTDDERAAWDRLSVFPGSFGLAAARNVADRGSPLAGQAGGVLASLLDKSVVLPAGGGRYRLPGPVREYAAGRLGQAGQEAAGRRRHAGWYLDLARDFGHHFAAGDQPARLARLRAEHANIAAALRYGFGDDTDTGTVRGAAHLAGALVPYWLMSGLLGEGIGWQDTVLARFPEACPERANALANGALFGALLGRPEALDQAREAIALAERGDVEPARARGYLALQLALGLSGAYPQALEAAARARRQLSALGAETALRCLDLQLAQTHQLGGDFDAAAELCQRTLAGLPPGERWLRGCAHVISALALYRQPGRQAECARAAGEGLRTLRDLDDLLGQAHALELLGWLAADDGRCERAAWLLGAAQGLWARAGGRLSGNAMLEECHARSAFSAGRALGARRYAELRARGVARPLEQIVALAVSGIDTLPEVPGPRTARDQGAAALPAGGPGTGQPGTGQPGLDQFGVDGLTGRERQIATLVAGGLSNREIAARLVISQRTVEAHVNHIFTKLNVSSRVQLTRRLSARVAAT